MSRRVYEDNFSRGSLVRHLDDNKEIEDIVNNHNLSSVKKALVSPQVLGYSVRKVLVFTNFVALSHISSSLSALIWIQVTGPEAM